MVMEFSLPYFPEHKSVTIYSAGEFSGFHRPQKTTGCGYSTGGVLDLSPMRRLFY
jgi:hypothetical protein